MEKRLPYICLVHVSLSALIAEILGLCPSVTLLAMLSDSTQLCTPLHMPILLEIPFPFDNLPMLLCVGCPRC